ncbi:Hypothetical predicted protein [Olea europaea subsp. europaea]|uniref:Bromodomain associated domain-containing protein n=1 Tax=Olea europaea subsp. europaea TaxID=158383 RepID=A0A8S0SPZ0_OLEEU|nr:Hypothetical predicted protein [Olea europaea subsp. europaea]
MALLGDDGRGYELARKLECHGVWRLWLGDSFYSTFIHSLSSQSSWDAFMRADDSKTKTQIQLQLRARALLFDKASVSLFICPSNRSSLSAPISKLNPNYLELHGDDVYFTLENGAQDADQLQPTAVSNATLLKAQSKAALGSGSRFGELEVDALSQRFKREELPETWYSQFYKKYRASESYKLSFGDRESEKRRPEQMCTYLKVLENHKRRRIAFKEDKNLSFTNPMSENVSNLQSNSVVDDSSAVDEMPFFPETMFTLNCVPDSAVLQTTVVENNQKVEFNGVLDNLPRMMTKSPVISPIMIERLGIRPEYLNIEQGGSQTRGKHGYQGSRKLLGQEQASQMSQKVAAGLLTSAGFEASSEVPLEVLAQFLSCHIGKLGRTLKVLADSYRKQCSAMELLKMFLKKAGYSNLGTLSELVKDTKRNIIQQSHVQIPGMQLQLQTQHQAPIQQSQQIPRQMNPILQQMNNAQHLAFQLQQRERLRRQQQLTTRPSMNSNMNMEKDRPMVQVKMENPSDSPLDNNAFTAMNARNPQVHQLRQQQLAAISTFRAQASNAFRPMNSLQVPQIQSPNTGMVRAQPLKVEGFQELMGGDASMKNDSEENKLISPPK